MESRSQLSATWKDLCQLWTMWECDGCVNTSLMTVCEPCRHSWINGSGRTKMLWFRATSVNPDVKMVTVHDPVRLLDHMILLSIRQSPQEIQLTIKSVGSWTLSFVAVSCQLSAFVEDKISIANLTVFVNKEFGFPGICCIRLPIGLHDHRSCRVSGFASLQPARGADGRTKSMFLIEIAAYEGQQATRPQVLYRECSFPNA